MTPEAGLKEEPSSVALANNFDRERKKSQMREALQDLEEKKTIEVWRLCRLITQNVLFRIEV